MTTGRSSRDYGELNLGVRLGRVSVRFTYSSFCETRGVYVDSKEVGSQLGGFVTSLVSFLSLAEKVAENTKAEDL